MGSFDYTCAISGLPIGAGDAVRFMLLTQNPYHRGKTAGGNACSQSDIWFPRTYPLRGVYNDYGSVEDLQTGPQADAWLTGFGRDLVEKGWGDNACHDVPTRKGMSMEDLLNATQKGRVHVRQDVGRAYSPEMLEFVRAARVARGEPAVPKGVPTRRRVERLLVKLGYKISESYGSGVLVNRVDANTVRVRMGDYADRTEALAVIRDKVTDFAAIVRAGVDDAELILCPLPGVRARRSKKREPSLCVASAMIREDVWAAICAMPLAMAYENTRSVNWCRSMAKKAWHRTVNVSSKIDRMLSDDGALTNDAIPFTVGLGTHWWAMVDAARACQVTDAERDDFADTAGELLFVMSWLGATRYQWRPSASAGPQSGEWGAHAKLLLAFGALAATAATEQARGD